jgi:CRP/FNR family transcriptional regulator, cyclic AMP receptor protein
VGEILQRRTFVKGEVVFKEGEEGNHAYVIQDGEVEIIKEIDGQTVVLGVIGKGGMFGEMALIDSKPRMAMARASKGSTIIVVTQLMFDQKMAKADPFIRGLLNILADHARSASK